MKKISHQGIILGILIFSLYACTTKDDSVKVNARSSSSTKKEVALTCEKLLDSSEDYAGQVIELSAICWGSSVSVDGSEFLMSIDDNKFKSTGLQQAHVLVHFTKNQEKEIENIAENDSISLTAKVGGYEFGALRLIEAKITSN